MIAQILLILVGILAIAVWLILLGSALSDLLNPPTRRVTVPVEERVRPYEW